MATMAHQCVKCDKEVFNNEAFEPQKCECGSEVFVRTRDEGGGTNNRAREARRERANYERSGEC
jgi:predicted  nucleic acid-binding Zn-ribbon protein